MHKMMDILKYIFRVLVVFVAVTFVAGEVLLPRETRPEGECELFEASWTMVREDGSRSPVEIPGDYDVKRNEKIFLETVLPESLETNKYLCFRSNRQDMEIYVGDKLRQKYTTQGSRPYGHSSTSVFLFMRIQEGDGGKLLRVSFQTDTGYSGKYRPVYYGDRMGIWGYWFQERGAELIAAVVLLLLGVFSIVGSLVLRFCYRRPLELEYLGWGVMLAACWMISDSIFRQLCFPNISIVNDLAFVMVMLMPYPFLIYLNEIQKRRYNLFYVIVCSLIVVDAVVCMSLQFLNLVDFADSISVFALFCGLGVLLIAVTMIVDGIKGYVGQYKLAAIGIGGASVAAVVQLVLYFRRNASSSGVMIAYGMIFLLVTSTISTLRDIIRGENEKRQAILANKSKAQFLANMSHEIRTPINAVLGMDEIILRETTESNIRDYAMDIQSAGKNLLALINDILDFSKIESGKMEILPVEYSLSSLIYDCYNMVAMRMKEKNLEFIVENDSTLPNRLYGDEVRVRQVIVNLLTNALKYTGQGSVTLSVQGERIDNQQLRLRVSVKDTGIGITEENCKKLFDSFRRVDEKRNRNIEGTGLGLAISKQIVDLMGGDISVESVYGKGSVFCVEIPQRIVEDCPMGEFSANPDFALPGEENPVSSWIAPEGRILVVDDLEMNLKVFCGLLKQTKLQIDVASGGKDALALVAKNKYHMIFLDHMMPDMDGIETFRAMKEMVGNPNEKTPVIMLTANAIVGVREEYLHEGFTDYLSKPIQGSQLEEMVKKYLPQSLLKTVEEDKKENGSKDMSFPGEMDSSSLVDCKTGLAWSGGDRALYQVLLGTYLETDKTTVLEEYLSNRDWKNYRIEIHALKSGSLSIGATALSEHAKAIELAIKEERIDFAINEHEGFLQEYRMVLQQVKNLLQNEKFGD